jgi:hypothetical protein
VSPARRDVQDVVGQYEALRREALEVAPFGPRGHGLALFLTRGMPAWLAALTALAPTRPVPCGDDGPSQRRPPVLPASRAELTSLLAGMVLACAPEEGHDDAQCE